jgi:gliding motility-associated-like protein
MKIKNKRTKLIMKHPNLLFLLFFFLFFQTKTNCQTAVKIVGDKGFCPTESANLTTDSVFAHYRWSTNDTTRDITVTRAGQYHLMVINAVGDTLRDTINITAFGLPQPTIGGTPFICPNRPTTIFVEQTQYRSYVWSTGEANRQILVSNGGSFSVSVVDQNGCRNNTSITVINGAPSALPLPDSVKICEGDSVVLNAGASDAIRYFWNTDDTTARIAVRTTGVYNVIVSNGQCVSYDTTHVFVLPKPVFSLGNDTMICWKDTLILMAHPDNFGRGPVSELFTYRWQDGSTKPTLKVTDAGIYSLTLRFGGCRVTDSFELKIFNKKQGIVLDSIVCTPQYRINPKVEGAKQYRWLDGSTQPFLDVSKAGVYQVLAYNGVCYADLSYKLAFHTLPLAHLKRDTVVCQDLGTTHLNLKADWLGAQYVWSTGDTTPSVVVTKSGLYFVALKNTCGSLWTSSYVSFKSCYASYIPNAFSPNGDNQNEEFQIYPASEVAKIRTFKVFDRWGNMVFVATNFAANDAPNHGWNGMLNGRILKPDVFIYLVELETKKGEVYFQRGDVTLMR